MAVVDNPELHSLLLASSQPAKHFRTVLGLVCFVGAKTIRYKILSNFTFQIYHGTQLKGTKIAGYCTLSLRPPTGTLLRPCMADSAAAALS